MDIVRKSRYLVNEDLLPLIDAFAQTGGLPLAERRAAIKALAETQEASGPRSERWIPGPALAPDVRILVYGANIGRPKPALLHIHGGGYVLGLPEMDEARNVELARKLGCVVVAVDYRLAPETPYPAALEDCYATLVWLEAEAKTLGVDASRIGVSGLSAGGGLAAGLALLARDRGGPSVAYQWLTAPMLDDRTGVLGEPHPFAGEFIWTAALNREGWAALLGRAPGGALPGPYAAPARVENLADLPPTLIQVGALDLFVEENMEYARRLMRAGVPTELHVYPGATHGCSRAPESRAAQAMLRDGVAAVQTIFGDPRPSDGSV